MEAYGTDGVLESNRTARKILQVLHYAYPIALLFFFIGAFIVRSIRRASTNHNRNDDNAPLLGPGGKPLPKPDPARNKAKKEKRDDIPRSQKLLFQWLSIAAAFTFIANAIVVIAHTLASRDEGWWCGQPAVIYLVGSFFVYSLFVISMIDTKPSPTPEHLFSWILATLMEIVLLGASMAIYTDEHNEPHVGDPERVRTRDNMTEWEVTEVVIDLIRILLLLSLIGFFVLFVARSRKSKPSQDPEETARLLGGQNGAANGSANGYGAVPNGKSGHHGANPGWIRPTELPSRSWWDYLKSYSLFFPYLWPSKDRRLQIVLVLCFIIVVLQRVVNVFVPIQVGVITNDLSGENGEMRMPWGAICLYITYRLLQGNNGLLGAARSVLWIPISQYSFRELSVACFEHVHGLSLDFHLGKKTGEVLSAMGKGQALNNFLEQVTFQVLPMLVDLVVAIGYFMIYFDAYYALVVSIVTFWYVYITIRMAQWRAEMRRQMVNAERDQDAVKNDSMVSYETVKYFNAETYEFDRYRNAVKKFQTAEYTVMFSLNIMNISQNLVFMCGLLISCFIAAYQVTTRQRKVGDFVMLLTYMAQLQQPLNFFGTFYRMIQSSMINSERMLELFKEKPTVIDKPEATTLPSCQGDIRFNEVEFSYDERKPALRGVNFHCPPGTTNAFVGESGGGKSTVFRLLFRFYNIQGGHIQLDGHDVEDITIDSLRRHIGVVPQDTVLFNESVMYNLKYANPDATDEQVFAACTAASIHEKIIGFPDGYQTKVGERGLRLSGGEKQRIAIARTILKNPRIIMLDEATAALDTETEEHIQDALTTLGEGRTMLIIAHRLSTITMADQIFVLHEGRVAEQGTHEELLAREGRYYSMWRKQIKAQQAAEKAKRHQDKADRLRRESKDGIMEEHADDGEGSGSGSSSPSEDEKRKRAAKRGKEAGKDVKQ